MMQVIHEITEENFEEERKDTTVNEKVKKYHDIAKLSWKDEKVKKELSDLWEDPTIWAYATLKDKQGNRLKLYHWQDKIINDKNRFIQIVASNQIGKTWAACIKALHHALSVNNASVIIVSKSEDQATMVLDEIKWMMKRGNVNFQSIKGEVDNRMELHVTGTRTGAVSRIKAVPCTESALGYPATLIIGDEVAFWENGTYIYEQILEPRTNTTKNWKHPYLTMGQIFLISNPNGQQGIYWKIWNEDDRFSEYRYCWLANPQNTWEEYESARKRLPSDRFDSVYGATFASASGGFITQAEYTDAIRIPYEYVIPLTQPFYLGGDFAGEDTKSRDVDLSVLYGTVTEGEGDKKIVKLVWDREFPQRTPKGLVYDNINRLNKTYNLAMFAYDKMGVGDSVRNDLVDKEILRPQQIESLTYSLPNKSEVYYNMKHLFEQRRIKLRDSPRLKEQLMALRFEKTEAGHMKIHHLKERIHDDHCFVAGTKILTDKGQRPIEELGVGDRVMTRDGYKTIVGIGNRKERVITKFGITATPDHPFITTRGIKKFINLKVSDLVYIWNEKLSSIEIKSIIDTLKPEIVAIEDITGLTQNGKALQNHSIDKSGKITLAKFQRDMLSTIKMVITKIIPLKILKSCQKENINHSIVNPKNLKKNQEKILKSMQDQKQSYGINQKKEENGIDNRQLNKVLGKRRVYNLSIEGCNEYFANNVLVHNCDALANACYAAMRLSGSKAGFVDFVAHKKISKKEPQQLNKELKFCEKCDDYYWDYGNGHVC